MADPPVSRNRIYPDNHFSAAVSFMVAEQFSDSIQMDAITRASKYGRMTGEFVPALYPGQRSKSFSPGSCHLMECPLLNGKLREVTDWLAGFEELLGYVVNSVSTSLG